MPRHMMPSETPKTIGPVTTLAANRSQDYITPEDVGEAMDAARKSPTDPFHAVAEVRREVLAVLGRTEGWGAEDASLCAFVAAKEDS